VDKSRARKPKPTPEDQAKAFRKAARELGADATDKQFQDALRAVAKAKPQPKKADSKR
jgi:hypothetical protein